MSDLFPDHPPVAEAAIRDLQSSKPAVRRAAAEALGGVVDPELVPQAVVALIHATDDLRPDVRAAAALSLGELGGRDAAEALIRCLDDGNSEVRQVSAVALGTAGEPCAVRPLVDKLASGSPDLRFQAATSLAEIDPEAAREPLLERLAEDDDDEVVAAAALALGAIGESRAAGRLAELLEIGRSREGEEPKNLFDLAYALADLGDERAGDELERHLGHPDNGWDAIVALEKLGTAKAVGALRDFAASTTRKTSRVERRLGVRAAAAVLKTDPEAEGAETCRQVLLSALGARKLEHRGLAVESLGEVGGRWAVPALERLRSRWSGRRLREEIDDALAAIRKRRPSEGGGAPARRDTPKSGPSQEESS